MGKKTSGKNQLRSEAEARLAGSLPAKTPARSAEELLYELQVHQIELEMQNEELRRAQEALEKSRDHYVEFFDFAPVGYITLDEKGVITEINLTASTLLGVDRNKLLHQRLAVFITPGDTGNWHSYFSDVLKQDNKLTCELDFRCGRPGFHGRLDCLRVHGEDKAPLVRIVLTDITERKRMDEVVHEQEEFFRMIAESTDDFIAVLDLEGRRIYNSPSYARLFGGTEHLQGTDSFAEIHPEDREHIRHVFRKTVQEGVGLRADFRFVLEDGNIRYMESRGGLIRNDLGHPLRVVVVSRDVTERRLVEEKIRNLAFHDTLTSLPNRRLLMDRLVQSMIAGKRSGRFGAVLFIDLDNFKPLNDLHGHAAGDLLLVEAAHRIAGCVRAADTVSRFGGDEFVVLLEELDTDRSRSIAVAGSIAEKIRIALADPYSLSVKQEGKTETRVTHRCTSSIGVELFLDHEMGTDDIIRRADFAMYQAKLAGRDSIRFFDPNLQPMLTGCCEQDEGRETL